MKRFLSCLAVLISMTISASAQAQTVDDGYAAYDAGHYDDARRIFQSLAKAGNAKAMNAIGLMYRHGNGFPEDQKQSCDWHEKSALAGAASGKASLSRCYLEGQGRPEDLSLAEAWCEKALAQGNSLCALNIFMNKKYDDHELAQKWGQRAVDAEKNTEARVLMNFFDYSFDGKFPTFEENFCILVQTIFLGKPRGYCD